jgi:hypothetical protein
MTIAKTDPLLTEKQQLVTMIYKNFQMYNSSVVT